MAPFVVIFTSPVATMPKGATVAAPMMLAVVNVPAVKRPRFVKAPFCMVMFVAPVIFGVAAASVTLFAPAAPDESMLLYKMALLLLLAPPAIIVTLPFPVNPAALISRLLPLKEFG